MASTPPSSADDAPDLDALRTAIGSGDPTLAMPALTKLRFCTDEEAVPLLVLRMGYQHGGSAAPPS